MSMPDPGPGRALGTEGPSTGLGTGAAMGCAYLFGFPSGLLFLLLERRDAAVRFAALQSILLSATWVATWIAYSFLRAFLGLIPGFRLLALLAGAAVGDLLGVAFLGVWLFVTVRAFQGQTVRLPWLAEMAERLGART